MIRPDMHQEGFTDNPEPKCAAFVLIYLGVIAVVAGAIALWVWL